MKILMINSVCGIRSTGRICTDLADALIEKGHEVRIAYGRETVPDKYKKYAVRIGSNIDVNTHALQSRLFDNTGFGSKKATEHFIEWVKQYDPDVIHLHNLHGYYINIEVLFNYLQTCGKKIIWTLHDCWLFTGHCAYFDSVKCDRWKTGCHHCPRLKKYPTSIGFDHSEKNYNKKKILFTGIQNMTIVTPSEWLASLVKESFLKDYPVRVINNGIDTAVFKPTLGDFREQYGLENKKVLLGVASAWGRQKGFYDFIKLSERIKDPYQVVLVGLTPKQYKEIPKSVLGIMRTNSTEELAQIYTSADIFLNLTYQDNYPTTNLESQACGTPCLTYRTGGSVESVPSENIVEVGNLDEVLSRIESPLSLKNQNVSKENMLASYLNIYNF